MREKRYKILNTTKKSNPGIFIVKEENFSFLVTCRIWNEQYFLSYLFYKNSIDQGEWMLISVFRKHIVFGFSKCATGT